jgi:CRP-like cAMP-binding protein
MRAWGDPSNHLLSKLSAFDYAQVADDLDAVKLSFKELIYEQGKQITHVYFVTSGVVSLVTEMKQDGDIVETGTVGREGMVGLPAFLRMPIPTNRALCQVPGSAMRMPVNQFLSHTECIGVLRVLLLRYTNTLMAMTAQTAACNRAHNVEARMARWLLMTHDRVDGDEFPLTQEFLGQMLGVHRPAVSVAGTSLQNAGVIKYTRGKITVIDRQGLERASCECYDHIREEFARAFDAPG